MGAFSASPRRQRTWCGQPLSPDHNGSRSAGVYRTASRRSARPSARERPLRCMFDLACCALLSEPANRGLGTGRPRVIDVSSWQLRRGAVVSLIRSSMRRWPRRYAGSFGAANAASRWGTPDLGAAIQTAPKSGVDDVPVRGDHTIKTMISFLGRVGGDADNAQDSG
jgi:hypothetical protein